MDAVYALGLIGLIVVALWAAKRQNEIFRVTIRNGIATVVRGRLAPSFLGDLRATVRHVKDGSVHALKEGGEPRLVFSSSIDERTAQRLRNAFALNTTKRL